MSEGLFYAYLCHLRVLTSTSIPRSLTIAIHPWLLAEGGRIWSFMSDGTDGLEEEQIPILFRDIEIESAAEWEVPVGRTSRSNASKDTQIRGSAVF